jgi:phospholipid transport system transporter-binding protein
MPEAELKTKSMAEGTLSLSGKLTLDTVKHLWEQGKSLFDQMQSPIRLEMQNVTQSDSAGVALLIAWVRYLRQQKKEILLVHPSQQMQAIVRVSGLTNLLPFTT